MVLLPLQENQTFGSIRISISAGSVSGPSFSSFGPHLLSRTTSGRCSAGRARPHTHRSALRRPVPGPAPARRVGDGGGCSTAGCQARWRSAPRGSPRCGCAARRAGRARGRARRGRSSARSHGLPCSSRRPPCRRRSSRRSPGRDAGDHSGRRQRDQEPGPALAVPGVRPGASGFLLRVSAWHQESGLFLEGQGGVVFAAMSKKIVLAPGLPSS